jgi:hypothetical protein
MMSTYLDPEADAATVDSSPKSVFGTRLNRLRRLFSVQGDSLSEQLSCAHEFVFDEINDVYCKHCRRDFT